MIYVDRLNGANHRMGSPVMVIDWVHSIWVALKRADSRAETGNQ